jgi:hypothetical protein
MQNSFADKQLSLQLTANSGIKNKIKSKMPTDLKWLGKNNAKGKFELRHGYPLLTGRLAN